jgi:hypothetical protein
MQFANPSSQNGRRDPEAEKISQSRRTNGKPGNIYQILAVNIIKPTYFCINRKNHINIRQKQGETFRTKPRPCLRPRSNKLRQQKPNSSCNTFLLKKISFISWTSAYMNTCPECVEIEKEGWAMGKEEGA